MKIRIEISPEVTEQEVVIICNRIDESVTSLQNVLLNIGDTRHKFSFCKDETEFILNADDVLFFETADNAVWAHTANDQFEAKYKLYELEQLLPPNFTRISKSTIINIKEVYSITRNITAASKIEFKNSPKVVYVSRNYYKMLKDKLAAAYRLD